MEKCAVAPPPRSLHSAATKGRPSGRPFAIAASLLLAWAFIWIDDTKGFGAALISQWSDCEAFAPYIL
jgi:hypothetical protein